MTHTTTTETELRQGIATLEYQLETVQTQLHESMGQLELALEDVGWRRMIGTAQQEFSRPGLEALVEICRLMTIKNPLIKQGVEVQCNYVFGQGVTISATNGAVNTVLQAFKDDPKNKAELTSHQAMLLKEKDVLTAGNVFLVLFTNRSTGRVRVRSLPLTEVQEIICNPQDAKEPWYYYRQWTEIPVGQAVGEIQRAYYPDWQYRPLVQPTTLGDTNVPITWDAPVYHIKSGGFSDMRFGIPDVYAAVDWAKAYKEFLEDWATITRALSRFAWKASTRGGQRGVAALKARLGTTLGSGTPETNPPPVTGATAIMGEGNDLTPIKTAGATTSMEDGRRLLLMVASALGLPETFFGDVSVGTLATATSLDRPTALAMANEQELWKATLRDVLGYVVEQAVIAPNGKLRGLATAQIEIDEGQQLITLKWQDDPQTGKPIEPGITIGFPSIVEQDQKTQIDAIVAAAKHLPDGKLIARLLLTALGVPEIDEVLAAMWPDGGTMPVLPRRTVAPVANRGEGDDDGA